MGPRPSAMLCLWVAAAALLVGSGVSDGARILAVFPLPARSHLMCFFALTKGLALKGHNVTVLSPFPIEEDIPNHTVILTSNILGEFNDFNFFIAGAKPIVARQIKFLLAGLTCTQAALNDQPFREVINNTNEKYDLILAEVFFMQHAMIGLSHRFNVPVVALHPMGTNFYINDIVGNTNNPAYVPNYLMASRDRMTLYERMQNTYFLIFQAIVLELFYYPRQQALLDEHFPGSPPLQTLLKKNLALTLVNDHHSLLFPGPKSPNVIEVGGIHLSYGTRPLPADLQSYLDEGKDGVVYFSMGSNVKIRHMEEEKKKALLTSLGALEMRVLMKWDGPTPANLSANIRLEDWVPQSDLLRHPNVRLFVTHGGLLSTQEAVFHGVPIIGIPIFADQQFNMRLAEAKGLGVRLDLQDLTKESLTSALQEVLRNPKYATSAKKVSAVFRSQPMKAVDKGVFWVEHVLTHGYDHLRPAAMDLSWTQLMLLDVLAATLVPLLGLLLCCRALRGRAKKAVLDSDKKNK